MNIAKVLLSRPSECEILSQNEILPQSSRERNIYILRVAIVFMYASQHLLHSSIIIIVVPPHSTTCSRLGQGVPVLMAVVGTSHPGLLLIHGFVGECWRRERGKK
jgi:hypothetical protein